MIPIKRADEASTGFVIYQYHKIQRAGDDNLRGKERLCLRFSADCILKELTGCTDKLLTQTYCNLTSKLRLPHKIHLLMMISVSESRIPEIS